jgi:hypothetical protein
MQHAGLDGRTHTARRFRDLYEVLCNDLGGASGLKEGQRQLARRAATLSVMSEAMEADIVRDMPFDSDAYGTLCDRLGRCLSRLGLAPTLLERGDRSDPRDIRVFRIIGGLPSPPPAKPKPEPPIGAGPPPIKPEPPAEPGWEPPGWPSRTHPDLAITL